jgi:chromate reductase, NAD(P)H dehydrogenase (quinone)
MKILAFAGSIRTGSFNKMLLQIAVEGARTNGAEVTHVDLREFHLPLYDPDQEARDGLPPGAKQLKALFRTHEGLLIASPEKQQLNQRGTQKRHRLGIASGNGRRTATAVL